MCRPMLVHRTTLVSFQLFRKNLGNLGEFLGKWFTFSPRQELPVRLCACVYSGLSFGNKLAINKCIFSARQVPINNNRDEWWMMNEFWQYKQRSYFPEVSAFALVVYSGHDHVACTEETVAYRYTRFFSYKIPPYQHIIKCVILNT